MTWRNGVHFHDPVSYFCLSQGETAHTHAHPRSERNQYWFGNCTLSEITTDTAIINEIISTSFCMSAYPPQHESGRESKEFLIEPVHSLVISKIEKSAYISVVFSILYMDLPYFFDWVWEHKENWILNSVCVCVLYKEWNFEVVQFSSVAQSCPTLCDPMDCSTPGLPVLHKLPEFTQTHVHWVGDTIQPSHPLSSPSSPTFNLFQHQDLFKWGSASHQVAKVLEFQLQHQSFQWTPRTDLL